MSLQGRPVGRSIVCPWSIVRPFRGHLVKVVAAYGIRCPVDGVFDVIAEVDGALRAIDTESGDPRGVLVDRRPGLCLGDPESEALTDRHALTGQVADMSVSV